MQIVEAIRIVIVLNVLVFCHWTGTYPAFSQTTRINADEAASKLKLAKIIDPRCALRLTLTGKEEATIITERNPKATDEDCKIDAVLLTKSLIEAYPKQIARVKVIFSQADGDGSQATVTAGDIKSFGSGAIDKRTLLDSIEIAKVSSLEVVSAGNQSVDSKVKMGPFQPWRLLLLEHISKLAQQGVNVKVFLDNFNHIEAMVGASNKGELRNSLRKLDAQLRGQDELTREARQPAISSNRRVTQLKSGQARRSNGDVMAATAKEKERGKLIRAHIRDMAVEGKDVGSYLEQLQQIRNLRESGRYEEASQLLDRLAHTFGID